MINLFNIESGKILPSEHCYLNEPLRVLMDEYPDDYIKIYAYLYYMSCYDDETNPYTNTPEHEKEDLILDNIGGDFSPDDELIAQALAFTQKLYQTPLQQLYLDAKIGVEKMGTYIRNTPISDGRDGNTNSYLKYLERFDMVCRSFEARYKAFKDEQEANKGRGGITLAYDEED